MEFDRYNNMNTRGKMSTRAAMLIMLLPLASYGPLTLRHGRFHCCGFNYRCGLGLALGLVLAWLGAWGGMQNRPVSRRQIA